MLFSLFLSLTSATLLAGATSLKIGSYTPKAFQNASPDVVSSHVVSLTRRSGSLSHAYLHAIRTGPEVNGTYGVAPLSIAAGQVFLAPITFGTQTFNAILDTGSSDTWLAVSGFQCFSAVTGAPQSEADCLFGPTYNISKTFKQIPNENFNVTYADQEVVTGIEGTEEITLAGITVKNQQVGVVDFAVWNGDGVSSGLIGLAFPSITSAFVGTDPSQDSRNNTITYNPIFTNMYTEKLVAPIFSLALTRGNDSGGFLAIGGLPRVAHSKNFAALPLQVLTVHNTAAPTGAKPQYQFYAITIQGFEILGAKYTSSSHGGNPNPFGRPDVPETEQVIIDSGTTLNYLASEIAYVTNAMFNPPALYDQTINGFTVECDAIPPTFGVDIAGQTFFINAADMIVNTGEGVCLSGIQDGGNTLAILGDVFLKNVLAVFDVGAAQMRFAAREYY